MSREVPVRFCEGLGVQFPRATRLVIGFEHEVDAIACLESLKERLRKFGLELQRSKCNFVVVDTTVLAKQGDGYLPQPMIQHPYPKDRFRDRLAAGTV